MTGTSTDAAVLLAEWEVLAAVTPGDRLFRTRRLTRPVRLDLRAGLREIDGAPCLIAILGSDAERLVTFETAGFRLSRAADETGILLVLSLEEPARRDLFAEICGDCIRSVLRGEDEGENDLIGLLAGRLGAWRAFLRDQAGGLARHEIIGLIGELLMLEALLERSANAVACWKSPDDGLHDFAERGHALEVKTALGAARRLRVSTLDQLDEAGLAALYVAHVRLVELADGETLGELSGRIEARLTSERERRDFRNALLRRGLSPVMDVDEGPRIACAGIEYYAVGDGFPRLRRGDVALGIAEAAYDVEVRALADFAVNSDDVLSSFGGADCE